MIYPPFDHYRTLAGSQTKGVVLAEFFARPTNFTLLGNFKRALLIHSYQCKHDFEMPDLMKDIGATKAGLFKLYICSMATHFATKFFDPDLYFIPS